MIRHELTKRSHHYSILVLGLAFLLSLFLFVRSESSQMLTAFAVGLFYFLWGVFTHKGEITTLRLVLEYAVIGLLASVILISLINTV